MSTPRVPEKAVEQHAATLAFRDGRWGGTAVPTFADMPPADREPYIGNARRDLEAALPAIHEQRDSELRERLEDELQLDRWIQHHDRESTAAHGAGYDSLSRQHHAVMEAFADVRLAVDRTFAALSTQPCEDRGAALVVSEYPASNERRYECTGCGIEFMVPLDDAPLPAERDCDGCARILPTRLVNGTGKKPSHQPEGIVSVKDYGAKGDGVTDDTAAITKAVEVATQPEQEGEADA